MTTLIARSTPVNKDWILENLSAYDEDGVIQRVEFRESINEIDFYVSDVVLGNTIIDSLISNIDLSFSLANQTYTIKPLNNIIFSSDNGSTQQIINTGSQIPVLFNNIQRSDNNYSYNSGIITVSDIGWYEIKYSINAEQSTSNQRTSIRSILQYSENPGSAWTEVSGGYAWGYSRNVAQGDFTLSSSSSYLSMIKGSQLRLIIQRHGGTGTLRTFQNQCSILVKLSEYIRPYQ